MSKVAVQEVHEIYCIRSFEWSSGSKYAFFQGPLSDPFTYVLGSGSGQGLWTFTPFIYWRISKYYDYFVDQIKFV
jgi:hypothetical protein